MTTMQIWTPIASGTATPEEARKILVSFEANPKTAGKLVVALRSWLWKAINQRRRDSELAEWHDLFKRAQARVRAFEIPAAQIQLLADMLRQSMTVANAAAAEDVLERRHAREILVALREAPSGELSKQELMRNLGLKDANLWRLMELLGEADLVQRKPHGREAIYKLTEEGRRRSANLPAPVMQSSLWVEAFLSTWNDAGFEDRLKSSIKTGFVKLERGAGLALDDIPMNWYPLTLGFEPINDDFPLSKSFSHSQAVAHV